MRNTETIEVTSCCQQEQGKESKKGTNKNKNQPKKITHKKKERITYERWAENQK